MKSTRKSDEPGSGHINCMSCNSYYVTWNASHPHGCRAFGFKSAQIPSVVVAGASQDRCLKFSLKPCLSDVS